MKKEGNIFNEEQLIRLAYSKKLKVHIKLLDGTWRNGFVVDCLDGSFYFKDKENDLEHFFYLSVEKVEPYIERGGF